MSNKETIKLIYVKNGIAYSTEINRALFLDQMTRFVVWYAPDNNNMNAQKLCKLIPELDTIKVNKDIIDTQDVPFLEYATYSNPEPDILKFRRPFKIIWEILQYYCNEAAK